MTHQERDMWRAAAANWKTLEETANNFISCEIDKTWWEVKRDQCKKSYAFCMLMATTRPKPEVCEKSN